MSTTRASAWTDSPHHGKRGPNGRRLCLHCGEELSEKRKRFTFCGPECRNEHEIRCHPSAARYALFARDRGVCARCGLDGAALDDAISEFGYTFHSVGLGIRPNGRGRPRLQGWRSALARQWLREQGLAGDCGFKSTWEAHHKQAVVEGGGGTGLDGYETLCVWCHAADTRQLAKRRADVRRGRLRLP